MSIFKALANIVFAPVTAVAEVVRDISGDNGESAQGVSIVTIGASSIVKGVARAVVNAADEVNED